MKNLLVLTSLVISMVISGLPHNFKIESNNLIWQKVYDSDNSIYELYESLRQQGNYEKIYIVRDEVIFTINFESKNELEAHGYKTWSYPSFLKPGGKFTGYLQKKEGKYRVTITNIDFNWNGDFVENIDDAALKKGEMRENTRTKKVIQLFDRYFNDKFDFSNSEVQNW
ncbi:MAG: hypothetical protein HKO81_10485 [Flavobacteriaceae bacterium]|nr:hypothetical protein [Bacteroidia bacterium]NNL17053.1 hypothetical protein [Flavobacteriaceae bacterium]